MKWNSFFYINQYTLKLRLIAILSRFILIWRFKQKEQNIMSSNSAQNILKLDQFCTQLYLFQFLVLKSINKRRDSLGLSEYFQKDNFRCG